jgi:hypothetical protein
MKSQKEIFEELGYDKQGKRVREIVKEDRKGVNVLKRTASVSHIPKTDQYQVKIPREIACDLGISKGDKIEFSVEYPDPYSNGKPQTRFKLIKVKGDGK